MKPEYKFIDRALFFPEQGILVIGDLHIGYDYMLRQSGILIPERQVKEIISGLKKIFSQINEKGEKMKKIIFIGDIKHAFSYEFQERDEFLEVMDFLKTQIPEKNIIFIKGNHDTIDYTREKIMKPYYIEDSMAFVHGHQIFSEIYDSKVKVIVSGHLHPSVILREKPGVKHEIYKCFLEGKTKGKTFIIVPSFLEFYEGTPVNYYKEDYIESFSIIPKKDILKAKIHVIGEDGVYEFGTVGEL